MSERLVEDIDIHGMLSFYQPVSLSGIHTHCPELVQELDEARTALSLLKLTCEAYQFQVLFYKRRLRLVEGNVVEKFKADPETVRALLPYHEAM